MDSSKLEIFKETFRKPCQIYRFLSETWKGSPPYLSRNLSYISKHRYKERRLNRILTDDVENDIKPGSKIHRIVERLKQLSKRNKRNQNGSHQKEIKSDPMKPTCFFHWICDDPTKTSQRTRTTGHLCPWCQKDFGYMDSLMTHLQCCHPRLLFKLVEVDGQKEIELTLNPNYDGSYCGFKYPGHNMRRDFRFYTGYPERRINMTHIIFFRPKKRNASRALNKANDFLFNGEADIDVCSGRLYYHSSTCLPIKTNEIDVESEAGDEPDWLLERTQLMIDEFTDVNEGEKELLKLWNLHIMKNHKYKSDKMLKQACMDFVINDGHTIVSRNLYKNFVLHLVNLYEFGLLGSGEILDCIRLLKKTTSRIKYAGAPEWVSN